MSLQQFSTYTVFLILAVFVLSLQEYHLVHIVTEAATVAMKQRIDEATRVTGWVPIPLNYQGTGFG